MATRKPFVLKENTYYQKSLFDIKELDCEKEFWNVNETISELAYLTHDYFRYYGKFPSKVGKMIIEELKNEKVIDPQNDFIIDNYAGSGTTLVEAKLSGFNSIGFDINPFAVLACRVKTYNYSVLELEKIWTGLRQEIVGLDSLYKDDMLNLIEVDDNVKAEIDAKTDLLMRSGDFEKWFSEDVLRQLAIIKRALLNMEYTREREFFDLGFFAIIRRVSRAHDAEVRPHINKKKRKRDAIEAYVKKISEMIQTMEQWNVATDENVYSNAYVVSNANAEAVSDLINKEKESQKKELGAVVSHPPYLNCFDYIPVYKLKFMWADGFEEIFKDMTYEEIKKSEIKSYPVSSDESINKYFEHNYAVYKNTYDNLKPGGICCIVIGDCTVKKELFSVHKSFIRMMEEIGFSIEKLAYRSTAYGMGRYAYNFRADYSEDKDSKQDAIIFFKK